MKNKIVTLVCLKLVKRGILLPRDVMFNDPIKWIVINLRKVSQLMNGKNCNGAKQTYAKLDF